MFQLSVIVPVFNEEGTVLLALNKLVREKDVFQIIIVDDGSTDRSSELIVSFLKSAFQKNDALAKKILLLRQKNQGKGSAIKTGLKRVTGNYVLIQDADCEYDPKDISRLVAPIKKGKVHVVYGSRFKGIHLNILFWNRIANSFLNFLVNILYGTSLSDLETCYKIIPTSLFRAMRLRSQGFDIEPEITCKLLKKRIPIFEVPISYMGRDFSEGKKITWRDGFSAVRVIVLERLS
ncbi:glycosyltransferase family 2 protein [soil metagenome]